MNLYLRVTRPRVTVVNCIYVLGQKNKNIFTFLSVILVFNFWSLIF